ncbi:regulatory protein RecX [Candidatus Ruminimicrobiellum ovillum]|uniref:regulatory protein RecX n=1 Tax=Candidatus Ruminimicrobiellum ovillum TaxID=1947927 RepID=UPI00355A0770
MPNITEIRKYPKIKDYFKIFFDNETAILIDAETIVSFGLKKSLFIDEDTFNKVLKHNNFNRITSYAFYLISHKLYSKKSLSDKLLSRGFEKKDIEKVITRFVELNYINDEVFAQNLVEYLQSRGKGPFYIKNELKQHDIDNEIISKVMESDEENETYMQIINIMKKKFSKFDGKDKNEVRKTAMFFQRRGFASQDIAKAFREFDAEIEED